jgi:hypothetical protein
MISRAVATRALLAVVTPAVLAMTANACSPAQSPSSASAAASRCDFVNYYHDEARNTAGPGRCSSDCDCDGLRTCSFDHAAGKVSASRVCEGTARPLEAGACNKREYRWNEAWNPEGPGRCSSDCACDGLRTCASGACQGTAR